MSAYLGRAVVDGRVRFLSVSALERADPRSGGCLRKWYYRYVLGVKDADVESERQIKAKEEGTALHAEIERYLRTGERALSALALAGLHMIPDPGPDLLIEHEDSRIGPDAPLRAAGIPVIVKVDCAHQRGTNKGASEVEEVVDPPGTIEVIDWKRRGRATDRSGVSILADRNELVRTIQMSGYGTYFGSVLGLGDDHPIRLSHGNFVVQPLAGRKVTKLHVVGECRRSWEYAEGVARRVVDAARETSVDAVDGNVHACEQYGGCPHRDYCTARREHALTRFFDQKGSDMSLLEMLQQNNPAPAAPSVAPAAASLLASITAPPAAPPAAPQVTIDMRAALEAEEAQQRAALAAPPGLAEALQAIDASGYGSPTLGGRAGEVVARLRGIQWSAGPGAFIAGTGRLAAITITEPSDVLKIAEELRQVKAAPPPAPAVPVQHAQPPAATLPQVLPPEAPASNPALAARPVEVAPPGPPPLPAPPAPEKRTRGKRAPKPADGARTEHSGDSLEVFVDAVPNCSFESVTPYVDAMLRALEARFCTAGIADVRCAPKDGPLGYGGWRGAIHAYVRSNPPAPATYYVDTRGNEIAAEVADALRSLCDAAGSLYVRGVR